MAQGALTAQRLILLVIVAGACAFAGSCAGSASSTEEKFEPGGYVPIDRVGPRDLRVDRLLEKLRSEDLAVQQRAHDELTAMGPEVLPQLLSLLRTDDTLAAWIAEIIAEWGFRSRGAAPVLAERLARGLDDAPVMAHALCHIGGFALPYVGQALEKGTDVGRQWAMHALDILLEPNPDPLLPEITRALRSGWTPLRENAASALASLGVLARPAFPDILAAASDPEDIVRGNIADALGEFLDCEASSSQAVGALLVLLEKNDHEYSHRKAAIALGQDSVRDARALTGLLDAVDDPGATEEAALSLVKLGVGTEKAIDILLKSAGSKAPDTRTIDLAARLRTGGPRGRRAAVRLLRDACRAEAADLRLKAVHLLAFVGDADPETARPELLRALEDKEQKVRAAAQEALRALDRILAAR